jgi:SAM-dependent methyltransferase
MKNNFEIIKKCRISDSKKLTKVLDLGLQPLANSLKKKQFDSEDKYPLTLSFCEESSLLQLNETIKKEILFDSYVWVTSTSTSAKIYSEVFFSNVVDNIKIDKTHDLILEIASNDGTFLKPFVKRGFKKVLGVDPAKNIVEIANKNNVNTINDYWSKDLANNLLKKYGSAKIVFARNVIPHVSELNSVISGVKIILDENGIGIFEIHDANIIFNELHYDSIYHEHLCYFTLKSITYLLNKYNLYPYDLKKSPISGGSFVIYFSKKKNVASRNLELAIMNEENSKINHLESWKNFALKAKDHRKKMKKIFSNYSTKKVVGFGSSARSQTFLNYCNFNEKNIDMIIDNNSMKQNLYSPGTNIKIVDFNTGINFHPDVIFILAWNFKDEIINLCKSNGYKGEYLVAFPNKPYIL